MPYIASNGGTTIIWQPEGYVLQSGEVNMGVDYPTTRQITAQFPSALAVSQLAALKVQAQAALDKSDTTMLRCMENGVAVPPSWVAYRKALRGIANGTDIASANLPAMPAYPAGT